MKRVVVCVALGVVALTGVMFGGAAHGSLRVDSLYVIPPAPITATADTPCGQTFCALIQFSLSATGGVPPYRFTCDLPPGLFIVGAHNDICYVQDAANDTSAPAGFEVTVNPPDTGTTTTTTTATTTTTTTPQTTTTPTTTTTTPTTTQKTPNGGSTSSTTSDETNTSNATNNTTNAAGSSPQPGPTSTTKSSAPTRNILSAVSITNLHSLALHTNSAALLFVARASNAKRVTLELFGSTKKRLAHWTLTIKKGSHHIWVPLPKTLRRLAGDELHISWSGQKPLTIAFAS